MFFLIDFYLEYDSVWSSLPEHFTLNGKKKTPTTLLIDTNTYTHTHTHTNSHSVLTFVDAAEPLL